MDRRTAPILLAARLIAAVALALALPGSVPAQVLDWYDISGPVGYSKFYELGDGTLFGIEEDLLVRSFDAGNSWQNFSRPGGPILEFAARGPVAVIAVQRAQAANFKQYYSTTDRGNTWTRIAVEGAAGAAAVHRLMTLAADGTPYALFQVGSKMAVERLVNGAWERMGGISGVYGAVGSSFPGWVCFDVDPALNFYIGSNADGIHSSRDGGQTWTKALPYRYVGFIRFTPDGRAAIATAPNGRTAGGVFVSSDRGATWNLSGMTDLYISGLSATPSNQILTLGTRMNGTETTVFSLAPGAADWDSAAPFAFNYRALHVTGAGRLIAASPELGLNISDDGGGTWNTDGIRQRDIFSLASGRDGAILAGTLGSGLFRTTDGGVRWSRVGEAGTPEYFYALLHEDSVLFGGTEHGLYASRDDGSSWTLLTGVLSPGGTELPVYAVSRVWGGPVVIGTAAGVFRSDDGGGHWSPSGLGWATVNAFATAPSGDIFAVSGDDGVFSSSDGGRTWSYKGLSGPGLQTVAVSENGQIYVGGPSGVFISTDGGLGWTRRIFTDGHVHSILFNGNFNVYAASSYGIFVTSDAGRSWASAGLDGLFVIALVHDPAGPIIAGVYKLGVGRSGQVITATEDEAPTLPVEASLSQNYPNPFNPSTTIRYEVASPSRVTLRVSDVLGRMSETVVDEILPAGSYEATWNGEGRPSGVYFYSLTVVPEGPGGARTRPFTQIRKMLLLK